MKTEDLKMNNTKQKSRRLRRQDFRFVRGRRIRTLNKGFGDPRVTITPCPYQQRVKLYEKRAALSSGKS